PDTDPDPDRGQRRILSRPAERTATRSRGPAARDGRRSRRQARPRPPPVFPDRRRHGRVLVAVNQVYGPLFDVTSAEAATPAMAEERAGALKDQFIMDMHTHFLRDDTRITTFVDMRNAVGKAGWNKELGSREQTVEDLKFNNYKK